MVLAGYARPDATGARCDGESEIDMMRFEWADVSGPGATIWNDAELDEVSEDGNEPGTVGVSMDTGSNGVMLYGAPEDLIAWAEDLAKRLRAGEGKSGFGEARQFVFMDGLHLVRDAEGDLWEAERLRHGHLLRDNSGYQIHDEGDGRELTGDTWQVMGRGRIGLADDGRGGFIVDTRKVVG